MVVESTGITGNETVARAVSAKLARPLDVAVVGDWDGNGHDDLGIYRNGEWHLRSSSDTSGYTARIVRYGGAPGDIPLAADTDGDGHDELVIYRSGRWHFRSGSETSGSTDAHHQLWRRARRHPGRRQLDGRRRRRDRDLPRGRWHLRGDNGGIRVIVYGGAPGDIPLVGDWDGNGNDDLVIYRSGRWHLRSSTYPDGATARGITYGGAAGDRPVLGHWHPTGIDTLGIYRSGRWHLRSSNETSGFTARIVPFGG